MTFDDREIMLIVAKEGGNNDWAAYALSNWMKRRADAHLDSFNHWTLKAPLEEFVDKVSDEGDKLYRPQAELVFPDWAKRLSWRD